MFGQLGRGFQLAPGEPCGGHRKRQVEHDRVDLASAQRFEHLSLAVEDHDRQFGCDRVFDIPDEGGRAHRSPTKFSGGGEVRDFGSTADHNGRRGLQIGSGEFKVFFSLRGGSDQVEPDVGPTELPFHDPIEMDNPDLHGAEAEAVGEFARQLVLETAGRIARCPFPEAGARHR